VQQALNGLLDDLRATHGENLASVVLYGVAAADQGAVQKGPLLFGSSIDVSPLNDSGNPTGEVFATSTINDLGEFSVEVPDAGPVSIEGSGYYYNEVSGALSTSLLTLRAFYVVSEMEVQPILINPVTHLTYDRVRVLLAQGETFTDAISIAEQELQVALGIGLPDLEINQPGTSLNMLGGDTTANAYLFAVSSVLAQAGVNLAGGLDGPIDAYLQEFMNQISLELSDDGHISFDLRATIDLAEYQLETAAVEAGLAARLESLNSDAVVPDLDAVLDQDNDLLVNNDDNCDRAINVDQADLDLDGIGDACDNCPELLDIDQTDSDEDGVGDVCDVECGDGELDRGEGCDDGNLDDDDNCTSLCQIITCGDGVVQELNGEACDDGNFVDDDECTNSCQLPLCGDGILHVGEACDDGNDSEEDGCTSLCQPPFCGDGITQGSFDEQCDDGNDANEDDCTNGCFDPVCGDGFVHEGVEACDDGNDLNDDDCTIECLAPTCGDGFVNLMEACDDGNVSDADSCMTSCIAAVCGDGVVWVGNEDCDDANDVDTDDCLTTCVAASCGDGFVQDGVEACEDGNLDDTDDCVGLSCSVAECGDGFFRAYVEECDDGNLDDLDSCSSTCVSNLPPSSTIAIGGTSTTSLDYALDNVMGETFTLSFNQWLAPHSADILIMSNTGGNDPAPDYNAHLNSGKHVLMFGGNSGQAFADWLSGYVTPGVPGWHFSEDCVSDWTSGDGHPMTALMPAQYEFSNQMTPQHPFHFVDAGQPNAARLLGRTCHQAPDNHVLITRLYNHGGSFTYMAFKFDGGALNDFFVPFLEGYLDHVRQ
jgi:cysteine-rich repeat protein